MRYSLDSTGELKSCFQYYDLKAFKKKKSAGRGPSEDWRTFARRVSIERKSLPSKLFDDWSSLNKHPLLLSHFISCTSEIEGFRNLWVLIMHEVPQFILCKLILLKKRLCRVVFLMSKDASTRISGSPRYQLAGTSWNVILLNKPCFESQITTFPWRRCIKDGNSLTHDEKLVQVLI